MGGRPGWREGTSGGQWEAAGGWVGRCLGWGCRRTLKACRVGRSRLSGGLVGSPGHRLSHWPAWLWELAARAGRDGGRLLGWARSRRRFCWTGVRVETLVRQFVRRHGPKGACERGIRAVLRGRNSLRLVLRPVPRRPAGRVPAGCFGKRWSAARGWGGSSGRSRVEASDGCDSAGEESSEEERCGLVGGRNDRPRWRWEMRGGSRKRAEWCAAGRWAAAFGGRAEAMRESVFRLNGERPSVSVRAPAALGGYKRGLRASRRGGWMARRLVFRNGSLSGERLRASRVARAVVWAVFRLGVALSGLQVRCGGCSRAEGRGRWVAAGSRPEDAGRDWPGSARGGRVRADSHSVGLSR